MGSFPPGKPAAIIFVSRVQRFAVLGFRGMEGLHLELPWTEINELASEPVGNRMVNAESMTDRTGENSAPSSVLLIEEDSAVRMSLVRALESEGFQIDGMGASVSFEEFLQGHSYQALVVSLETGSVESGRSVGPTYRRRSPAVDWDRIRRIRQIHPGGCLVALTVSRPVDSMEGVDAVVEKPVSVPGLVSLLNELLHPMQPMLPSTARTAGGPR